MQLLHVRHATSLITYNGLKILIDPVFAPKGRYDSIASSPNPRRNPIVDLTTPLETLTAVDLVLCTHTHRDHFDELAFEMLDKSIPIVCQDSDQEKFKGKGFMYLYCASSPLTLMGISVVSVPGQHGRGLTAKLMGRSSGYVLSSDTEPTLYLTGDTVYTRAIKNNIQSHRPDVVFINGGSAKFTRSGPITMNSCDIKKTMKVQPNTDFVIVHLESYNHCIESRAMLETVFSPETLQALGIRRMVIPKDHSLHSFEK